MDINWHFNNEPIVDFPESAVGFVYCITNLLDGRDYIGKKKLTRTKTLLRTVTLKSGIKKKKKIKVIDESDWKDYYGSSEELKKDVATLGEHNFRRNILRYCYSLTELSYYEAKFQFESDCLLNPDKYYNSWISCRVRRSHLIK